MITAPGKNSHYFVILFSAHCKKIFSRFVITTFFLLSNQLK